MDISKTKVMRELLGQHISDDGIVDKLMAAIAFEVLSSSLDSDLRKEWCVLCADYTRNGYCA